MEQVRLNQPRAVPRWATLADWAAREPDPTWCVSLDPRPLHVRARPLQAVVRDHPEALVGSTLQVQSTNNNNTRQYCAMRQAKVVAWMPEEKRHVLVAPEVDSGTHEKTVMLVDLRSSRSVSGARAHLAAHEGYSCEVEPRSVLAPLGTHTVECLACCSRLIRGEMAEFCYGYCKMVMLFRFACCPSR